MAPNFEVIPSDMRGKAQALREQVAPLYGSKANKIRQGGEIEAPGFGIALSWLKAGYDQRLDFLAKDLDGAERVCREIAQRLEKTADQYQRAENLNIEGLQGKPVPAESYGEALGEQFDLDSGTAGAAISIGTGVGVGGILAILSSMGACSALCPTFIPATTAAALFVANPVGIFTAATELDRQGKNLLTIVNAQFDKLCTNTAVKWTGAGKDNFVHLTTKIKGHLDQIGEYLKSLGGALFALDTILGGLWLALGALVGPFLAWLIAARIAQAASGPFAAAAEAVIETTSAMMAGNVMTLISACLGVLGAVGALIAALAKEAFDVFVLPDAGTAGTPDMTEFSIDTNFRLPPEWNE